jgi:hypothetical protein
MLDGIKSGIIAPAEPRVVVYALPSAGQSASRWCGPHGKVPLGALAEELADPLLFGLVIRTDDRSGNSGARTNATAQTDSANHNVRPRRTTKSWDAHAKS